MLSVDTSTHSGVTANDTYQNKVENLSVYNITTYVNYVAAFEW